MQLDPSRASRVYGSSRAAWFQDGQYFTHDGQPIAFEEAAGPSPSDIASGYIKPVVPAVVVEPPVVTTIEAKAIPVTVVEPERIADLPVEREVGAKSWGDDQRIKLKALKPTVLASMVLKAGGTPNTGSGSKRANIEWLLDNVP
jgi:hypothetical protein